MQNTETAHAKPKKTIGYRIFTVIGIVLCVILIPMLILNVTMIIKSYVNPDKVPSFGGFLPMIVLTDSMYPTIEGGDLVICSTIEPEEVKENDIISFFDPSGNGTSVVTHRVMSINNNNGQISFVTKGDANNAEDQKEVPAEKLVGIYKTRIPGMGNVAMFMQTTPGLIVCVVCPLLLLIGYDVVRRRLAEKNKQADTDELMAELEALKAANANVDSEVENAFADKKDE